jgi:hypothetical protein
LRLYIHLFPKQDDCWYEIPDHIPFVKLGAFVVMPNHIQGVIFIDKTPVETQDFASLQTPFSRQDDCWYEIPDHIPFVKLGAYVVNAQSYSRCHFHG